MSKTYKFIDEYFALSESKIHYLRNGFEHRTSAIDEYHFAEIKKGKAAKNWLLLLVFGIALIFSGFQFGKNIIDFLLHGVGTFYIEGLIFPLFLLFIGGYAIYFSLRKQLIIEFRNDKEKVKFPINAIIKENQLQNFVAFLETKIKTIQKI